MRYGKGESKKSALKLAKKEALVGGRWEASQFLKKKKDRHEKKRMREKWSLQFAPRYISLFFFHPHGGKNYEASSLSWGEETEGEKKSCQV